MAEAEAAKSARRGFEILELFEKLRRPAPVSLIARSLGYPQSSTSVLLKTLRELGYLSYDPEERVYAPTMRVALLGAWVQVGNFGRANILELLSEVHRSTGETTILATQNGLQAQYVHVLETDAPLRLVYKPGTLRPLCRVAAGLAILAQYDDATISRLVRNINATAATPEEREDVRAVLREVARTRRDGHAYKANGVVLGMGSVALRLPVTDGFGNALVASVSAPVGRLRERRKEIVAALRRAVSLYCWPTSASARHEQWRDARSRR